MINDLPLVIVCGPTATGKTAYALKLAKEKNGELINVDSRQVYKYLDIGTGKDLPSKSKFQIKNDKLQTNSNNQLQNYTIGYYMINNVPLWLYDVVTPNQQFSAFEYAVIARLVINDVWKRDKLPILVGGSGLYINAVVDGFTIGALPDWNLRNRLNNEPVEKLQERLNALDHEKFEQMNKSDRNNPRRLVRAIEIAGYMKTLKHENMKTKPLQQPLTENVQFIGLTLPNKELYRRIDARVEERMRSGMINEINQVVKIGYTWDDPGLNTLGYKQLKPYFEKRETLEESVQKWQYAEHAYARRQKTWFKKDKRIVWAS